MRIYNAIEKKGLFWLENNSEYKVPGILKIFDGGKVSIDLFYSLADSQEEHSKLIEDNKISVLYGELENNKFVTLFDCIYNCNSFERSSLITCRITAKFLFIGNTTISIEEKFNKCIFSTEGLFEWIAISGVKVDTSSLLKGNRHITIAYDVPQYKEYTLNNKLKINIVFSGNATIKNPSGEFKILQQVYLSIENCNQELTYFIDIMHKITNFLNFILDENISIDMVKIYSNCNAIEPFELYYPSTPFFEKSNLKKQYNVLIPYKIISERFSVIINKWLEAYNIFGPALALYFYAKKANNIYADGKFLSIIQAIETYSNRVDTLDIENTIDDMYEIKNKLLECCPDEHKKWLKTIFEYNNITLRKRLEKVTKEFKQFFQSTTRIDSFIYKLLLARNYLTHYNIKNEKEYKTINIYQLYAKTSVLFMLIILKYIGFSIDEIEHFLNSNPHLKLYLDYTCKNN